MSSPLVSHRSKPPDDDTTAQPLAEPIMESYDESQPIPSSRRVLMIATGGTIGSKMNEQGTLAPEDGYLKGLIMDMPEMKHECMPKVDLQEWPDPLDSSDFDTTTWLRLSKQIAKHYYQYDGFVVLHGTDTMAYTASALSFVFEHLGKPVILTGAMIPLADVHNDAQRNLVISTLLAAHSKIPEVCLFFNKSLYRGNRCRKFSCEDFDAFNSPNLGPLAVIGTTITLKRRLLLPAPVRRFTLRPYMHKNVAVIVITPTFDPSILDRITTGAKHLGLVLSLYGTGNAPIKKPSFVNALKRALQRGTSVVVTSQCHVGRINMSCYATGLQLLELGVIDGQDMTLEACVTKLSHLMGRGLRGRALKRWMEANMRGELSPPSLHLHSPLISAISSL